ncbi:hypothetical protein B0H17DRAFT_1330452 [Mycena rosella]|uniref:Fungal-type protein kinase domain-containing protein n=1 Tax=Mycena rosella TaxID=1033263 RepID=A0AAD7GLF4_MYCRO|nr:hypothetical protein B0H17DRAFT_1330452 [Mycena rosella]
MMRWKHRVMEGFSRTESVSVFLSEHMEGNIPGAATIAEIETRAEPELQHVTSVVSRAKVEKAMYKPFVTYLQKIVQDFPFRPTFADTHAMVFERLHPSDHDSMPDVTGLALGSGFDPRHPKWEWRFAGTVIEFKFTDDPISNIAGTPSQNQLEDLVQLIQNARRIIMASGCCYSFVVSVFGTSARLFRVDRSGYIATDAFDWTQESKVFPEFYWRLYNGGKSGRMLGADFTLSVPTLKEKQKMYALLVTSRLSEYSGMKFEEATAHSRWVEVIIDDKVKKCFTVGDPIFQSKGLFCRGTRVDRVLIEDGEAPAEIHVLKDAWQQACRRPESDFYAVIRDYVHEKHREAHPGDPLPVELPVGLNTCLGSYNLGDRHPSHRTITAALRKDGHSLQDRVHNRTVSKHAGFALEGYLSTEALVQALKDAIEGHRIALEAGVLHRDVSVGNILIGHAAFLGFKLFPNAIVTELDKNLKDMTGTYPYLSIDLLEARQTGAPFVHECKHDLESFYYILIWILLRHANHSHPNGEHACPLVFDKALDADAIAAKKALLTAKRTGDFIPNNLPLSQLVDDLADIFLNQSSSLVNTTGVPATHASVLAAFDKALKSEGWPDNDPAKPFVPPIVDQTVIDNNPPSASLPSLHAHSLPVRMSSFSALPAIPFLLPDSNSPSLKRKKVNTMDESGLEDQLRDTQARLRDAESKAKDAEAEMKAMREELDRHRKRLKPSAEAEHL